MKIVVLGGGPVGQMFAIRLYEKSPQTEITIVELRRSFSRPQVMLLNKKTIDLIPPLVMKRLLKKQGCYVIPPPLDRRGACYKFSKTPLFGISLNILEMELYNYVKNETKITFIRPSKSDKLNIRLMDNSIKTQDADSPPKIIDYDYLIGADGINSLVRQTFIENKKIDILPETMYGLTLIMKTDKNTRIYDGDRNVPKLNQRQDRVRFFRQSNNSIYLAVALTAEEYDKFMKEGDPTKMNGLPNWFKPTIKQYMEMFDIECHYKNIDKCVTAMSYFPIRVQRSVQITDNKRFLVGDAAFNTHYFTGSGLNVGVDTADQLATLFHQLIGGKIDINDLSKSYTMIIDKGVNFITDRVLEVRTDYKSIADKCKEMTIKELKTLAKLAEIPHSYFSKKELCYLLKETLTIKD